MQHADFISHPSVLFQDFICDFKSTDGSRIGIGIFSKNLRPVGTFDIFGKSPDGSEAWKFCSFLGFPDPSVLFQKYRRVKDDALVRISGPSVLFQKCRRVAGSVLLTLLGPGGTFPKSHHGVEVGSWKLVYVCVWGEGFWEAGGKVFVYFLDFCQTAISHPDIYGHTREPHDQLRWIYYWTGRPLPRHLKR